VQRRPPDSVLAVRPRSRANMAHIRQPRPDSGLAFQVREGCRESRRCSTYPESYITEYTSVYEDKTLYGVPSSLGTSWWMPRTAMCSGVHPIRLANMAHISQSRPYSGLGSQTKVLFGSWISGKGRPRGGCRGQPCAAASTRFCPGGRSSLPLSSEYIHYHCRANMPHIRQPRPDSDLAFQVKVLKTFCGVPNIVVNAEDSHVQQRPPNPVLEVAVRPDNERIWHTQDSQGQILALDSGRGFQLKTDSGLGFQVKVLKTL